MLPEKHQSEEPVIANLRGIVRLTLGERRWEERRDNKVWVICFDGCAGLLSTEHVTQVGASAQGSNGGEVGCASVL